MTRVLERHGRSRRSVIVRRLVSAADGDGSLLAVLRQRPIAFAEYAELRRRVGAQRARSRGDGAAVAAACVAVGRRTSRRSSSCC